MKESIISGIKLEYFYFGRIVIVIFGDNLIFDRSLSKENIKNKYQI